jgi:hypothetical protein
VGSLELAQEGTPFAHEPIGNTWKRIREHAVRLLECQSESLPMSGLVASTLNLRAGSNFCYRLRTSNCTGRATEAISGS